jgi:hypothetical protein
VGSLWQELLYILGRYPETLRTHPELVLIGFVIKPAQSPLKKGVKNLSLSNKKGPIPRLMRSFFISQLTENLSFLKQLGDATPGLNMTVQISSTVTSKLVTLDLQRIPIQ